MASNICSSLVCFRLNNRDLSGNSSGSKPNWPESIDFDYFLPVFFQPAVLTLGDVS